jgi:two-component system, NtrC family, sensor histidine kinase HydH
MNARTLNEPVRVLPEITSIVHDLRNPLSTIHGSAELLISSRLSEPQIQRIGRNMYGASIRIKELLDEVLTRFRGGERGAEPTDLGELVASAVDKIALVAEAQSVEIVQNVPQDLVLPLDRQRIQRVLVNLLVNALDVMPDGGTIRISALMEKHSVQITVRDTGPGIAPEIRDRIFQPFVTAGKASGLGLGLAFSRQAVIDHGGRMWVESGSVGACFAFCLPRTGRLVTLLTQDIPDGRSRQQ